MASSSTAEQPPRPLRIEQYPIEGSHRIKSIRFLGRRTPIILQNHNGPCPLLAICNVLLLRNQLNLSADVTEISQEKLLSLVTERLIDSNSNVYNRDAEYVQNQQQNIADAIDLLPRLVTGIDVNVKFRRIDDFEFTRECTIFDLLDIPLYHGWLVDPQDQETAEAIGSKSYNAITLHQGELITSFLKNNASQLTFYGLFSLQEGLKDRELCVFFRNNHLSTMFKYEGDLYILTTDQGYLNQPGLVWEKLNEVNGDSLFYDSDFKEFRPNTESHGTWDVPNAVASTTDIVSGLPNSGDDGSSIISSDRQLAMALQQEEYE